MDSFERCQRRLQAQPVDRPPNFDIFMTFAAHHIGARLSHYYLDHRVLVAANIAMLDLGVDLVQAISDPYREGADLGVEVEFPDDALPLRRRGVLEDPADLARLQPVKPADGRRMSDRLDAVRRFCGQVGGRVPVMGWVEGALAELNVLRGDTHLMVDLYDRPEWVLEALEFCTGVEIAFARAQVQAGADIIGLGDAIASQLSPAMYARFALPFEQRIFAAVHEMGARTRLHICGNTSRIVPLMTESGADIIDLDWMVDFGTAARTFEGGPAPCGNFDPVRVMLQGTPQEVRSAVHACLVAGGPRSFSAAGCEVPDGTPLANLHARQEALLEWMPADEASAAVE